MLMLINHPHQYPVCPEPSLEFRKSLLNWALDLQRTGRTDVKVEPIKEFDKLIGGLVTAKGAEVYFRINEGLHEADLVTIVSIEANPATGWTGSVTLILKDEVRSKVREIIEALIKVKSPLKFADVIANYKY